MACDIQNHHSNQQPQEEQAADERHQMQTNLELTRSSSQHYRLWMPARATMLKANQIMITQAQTGVRDKANWRSLPGR
jgi:hypothetical protein